MFPEKEFVSKSQFLSNVEREILPLLQEYEKKRNKASSVFKNINRKKILKFFAIISGITFLILFPITKFTRFNMDIEAIAATGLFVSFWVSIFFFVRSFYILDHIECLIRDKLLSCLGGLKKGSFLNQSSLYASNLFPKRANDFFISDNFLAVFERTILSFSFVNIEKSSRKHNKKVTSESLYSGMVIQIPLSKMKGHTIITNNYYEYGILKKQTYIHDYDIYSDNEEHANLYATKEFIQKIEKINNILGLVVQVAFKDNFLTLTYPQKWRPDLIGTLIMEDNLLELKAYEKFYDNIEQIYQIIKILDIDNLNCAEQINVDFGSLIENIVSKCESNKSNRVLMPHKIAQKQDISVALTDDLQGFPSKKQFILWLQKNIKTKHKIQVNKDNSGWNMLACCVLLGLFVYFMDNEFLNVISLFVGFGILILFASISQNLARKNQNYINRLVYTSVRSKLIVPDYMFKNLLSKLQICSSKQQNHNIETPYIIDTLFDATFEQTNFLYGKIKYNIGENNDTNQNMQNSIIINIPWKEVTSHTVLLSETTSEQLSEIPTVPHLNHKLYSNNQKEAYDLLHPDFINKLNKITDYLQKNIEVEFIKGNLFLLYKSHDELNVNFYDLLFNDCEENQNKYGQYYETVKDIFQVVKILDIKNK